MKGVLITAVFAALSASAMTEVAIEDLIGRMTLEEKIGQLVVLQSISAARGAEADGFGLPQELVESVRGGSCGALVGAHDIATFNALQRYAVKESRLGIPLLVGDDVIRATTTRLPCPLGLSCAWDADLWQRGGRLIALEAPLQGCNWVFAPTLDVCRDARSGRIAGSPGQDSYLAGRLAAAFVKGVQSTDVELPVAACLKSFAGSGASFGGRDGDAVEMSESTFRNVYLPPFKAGIEAGALTVMPAGNALNGVPCSLNKWLLTDILRKHLGFTGFTISDRNALGDCLPDRYGMGEDGVALAEPAIRAGLDLDLLAGVYRKGLLPAVKDGKVPMSDVNRAVKNVLKVKNALGLFEKPYINAAAVRTKADLASHAAFAREAAAKSCVLLKNENGALPLKPDAKIALVGPGADEAGDRRLAEGFRAAGLDFTYTPGYGFHNEPIETDKLAAAARDAAVVVAIFGTRDGASGADWGRLSVELSEGQLAAFAYLKTLGKPIVVLLTNGRPLAIPEFAAEADAILEVWRPGTSGGAAIADVLTGKFNPQGRLTTEFPITTGQLPLFYNRLRTGHSGYRDGPDQALYPFGHGLSYTSFAYANEEVKIKGEGDRRVLVIEADVTNTGTVPGVEVAQVYTRQLIGVESLPIRELRAWKRVHLAPGVTRRVTVEVPVAQLASWTKDQLMPATGRMRAWICHDSVSGKTLEFTL